MLYTLDMSKILLKSQEKILEMLSGKIDEFYLTGGTALSLFYFHHRLSGDLDFFTRKFDRGRIVKIVEGLSTGIEKPIELIGQQMRKNKARMLVYRIIFDKKESLRIDFVEDFLKFIKPVKVINGIGVLSLEDIYLRKLYAVTGFLQTIDSIEHKEMAGGRQEAKDFYDLYCLSQIFMRLSDFAAKYCDSTQQETLVRWFRTYDRLRSKTGLLELKVKKKIDYRELELHFKKEIDNLLERELRYL